MKPTTRALRSRPGVTMLAIFAAVGVAAAGRGGGRAEDAGGERPRGRGPPPPPPRGRTIVAAAFPALVSHTMTYASFLGDPITWTLIGLGIAIRLSPAESASASSDELLESPSEPSRTASYSR